MELSTDKNFQSNDTFGKPVPENEFSPDFPRGLKNLLLLTQNFLKNCPAKIYIFKENCFNLILPPLLKSTPDTIPIQTEDLEILMRQFSYSRKLKTKANK